MAGRVCAVCRIQPNGSSDARTEDGSSQFRAGHTTFTGMYTADQMMGYAGSTLSYGEPCSYGGGSSTAQHEIGPSQLDEPPPITQPIQDYGYINFSGVEVAHI
ncbi:hypothetical protein OsI_19831 [Oryza sativa Indica Group]|uniref:Uncharacterized protein n=1 Tax=Oryza sativa subsp. indica TaxID=39946 RepID=B8AXZ0_ORYSI|nr:hypothetical protein OsI_19831 [Oryza sativa Indica Group]